MPVTPVQRDTIWHPLSFLCPALGANHPKGCFFGVEGSSHTFVIPLLQKLENSFVNGHHFGSFHPASSKTLAAQSKHTNV